MNGEDDSGSNAGQTNAPTTQNTSSAPVTLRSSTLQSLIRQGPTAKQPAFIPRRPAAGTATTAPKPKIKSSFSFSPNVARTSQPKPKPKPAQVPGAGDASNREGMSVQNLLAHQLAVQGSGAPLIIRRPPPQVSRVVSATLQNKMAQYENMRNKKRNGKKSREILELSWPPADKGDDISLYTPISLPYVIRDTADDVEISNSSKATDGHTGAKRKSQRPSIKNVDEANRNASKLFDNDDSQEDDMNNWCLVQLPSLLPSLNKEAMEKQKEEAEEALMTTEEINEKRKHIPTDRKSTTGTHSGGFQNRSLEGKYIPSVFSGLPEGKLGTIQIRQSGKAQFVMGDHVFDVNAGSDCNFAQDVGCFIDGSSEFFFLGRCLKKMTITPDVQRIIEKTRINH
eukprot:Gregarina_sp_Poly_1__266@NODE_1064_length_5198_cov_154_646658_g739_i0_p3_GENE_NODE_1064_length_5198_cov_154_646658_g739_i0NODE_1064_length_5198_cov_154_646658_g739_i0_p3_ORF_typecomplete_len397_score64_58RNA_pol_Rpc4/PF05132_14/7e03RNA_pol_Rpc4/PF05132_14/5_2e02RNA_pol_Rpc4/PF05132_14/3_4e25STAS_2/PF13466_6/0_46_NODE_1064_length_5198_cov_154_646658_g739_i015742764